MNLCIGGIVARNPKKLQKFKQKKRDNNNFVRWLVSCVTSHLSPALAYFFSRYFILYSRALYILKPLESWQYIMEVPQKIQMFKSWRRKKFCDKLLDWYFLEYIFFHTSYILSGTWWIMVYNIFFCDIETIYNCSSTSYTTILNMV